MTNKDFLVYSRLDGPRYITLVSRDLERGWNNVLDSYNLYGDRRGQDNGWGFGSSTNKPQVDLSCPLMSEELMYWE